MSDTHLSVRHKEVVDMTKRPSALDLSRLDEPKRTSLGHAAAFAHETWRDLASFWQQSYGAVRLYLTPEEAGKERMLFASSLLLVFVCSLAFLGVSRLVNLVHVSQAEQERLAALPDVLKTVVAERRIQELPAVLASVEEVLGTLDAYVAPGKSSLHKDASLLQDVEFLRQALREMTEAGKQATPIITAVANVFQDIQQRSPEEMRLRYGSLTDYIFVQWKVVKEQVYPHLVIAADALGQVSTAHLPESLRGPVEVFRSTVQQTRLLVESADQHMPAFLALLGSEAPRTYAVLLQSSGEMRATGGFIGSFALVKINDGWIEYIRFRDVYDVDGQIFENVPPPPGIESISSRFSLRDSNYWPDFPTSAKQVAWFLDKDKGPGIDGVFAISDKIAVRLLEATGPVGVDGMNIPVSADNFLQLMSFLVESKQDKTNPKSAVFDFAEGFLPVLTSATVDHGKVLAALGDSIEDRLILGYAFDPRVEALLEDVGIAGTVYQPSQVHEGAVMDFFMPVFTATGGNKSDRYVQESITHDTRVNADGLIEDEVTLVRRHTWNPAEEERIVDMVRQAVGQDIDPRIMEILGGERNRSYVRFFVPKGATLLAQEGVEKVKISEDLGRTVFGFESIVEPGTEERIRLRYTLPPLEGAEQELGYHLVVQKQPGGDSVNMTKTVTPTERGVVMADTTGYSVVDEGSTNLRLDMRPQLFTLRNIWSVGYLLRID